MALLSKATIADPAANWKKFLRSIIIPFPSALVSAKDITVPSGTGLLTCVLGTASAYTSQSRGNMRLIALALMAASLAVGAPTFTKDVAPILYKNCVACHRPGEIAPMSLLEYQSARPWAKAIRTAVVLRKMPPWFADPRYGHFSNDARLTEQQIETIKAWVDGGAAEGNRQDLPAPPTFVEGGGLGKPDLVIDIGQDFTVPSGTDLYADFVVPTNFTEGKWIRAAQVLPGNRKLVHHAHVYVTSEDGGPPPGPTTTGNAAKLAGFAEITNGLSRVRDDAPVIDNACADNSGLPNLAGFEEGSLATMLP